MYLQAAIVRIMKARKVLRHNALIQEVSFNVAHVQPCTGDRHNLVRLTVLQNPRLRRCNLQNSFQHSTQQIGCNLSQCRLFCHQIPINTTHHCDLYSLVGWPSLHTRRQTHWLQVICKSLLGKAPPYLSALVTIVAPTRSTRSKQVYFTGQPQSRHLLWPPFLPVLCCQ